MLTIEQITTRYNEKFTIYESLKHEVESLIKKLLVIDKIIYQNIASRVKTLNSVQIKFREKHYNEFTQLTDFLGIRIITYTLSDVEKVCKTIESNFNVIEIIRFKDRLESSAKVGYLSIHLICKFSDERIRLTEYSQYNNMVFEIQIRTILQHAWAEIEHDKYKFEGDFPPDIKRRFDVLSATLELVDYEFDTISKLKEEYTADIYSKTQKRDLHIPINTISIAEYLRDKLKDIPEIHPNFGRLEDRSADLIAELSRFGIQYINQLDALIEEKYIRDLKKLVQNDYVNYVAFLRYILMIIDGKKYFSEGLTKDVTFISKSAVKFVTKFGVDSKLINSKLNVVEDML